MIIWTRFDAPVHSRPPSPGPSMIPVKQFTSMASLGHVLMHALLITVLMMNMVMTLPAFS